MSTTVWRVRNWYTEEAFTCRLDHANKAYCIDALDAEALRDMRTEFYSKGMHMPFSPAQKSFLERIARRGGWREAMDNCPLHRQATLS